MLIIPEIYLGSELKVQAVLIPDGAGGLTDDTDSHEYCCQNGLPYTPPGGIAVIPVGLKASGHYYWKKTSHITAFLLISESALSPSESKKLTGMSAKHGANAPEQTVRDAGVDVPGSREGWALAPVIPVMGVSAEELRKDRTALLRFRLLLKEVGSAIIEGKDAAGSSGRRDHLPGLLEKVSKVPLAHQRTSLSVALCMNIATYSKNLSNIEVWRDDPSGGTSYRTPRGHYPRMGLFLKPSVLRSVRPFLQEVWKRLACPDKRWVELQEAAEEVAGSINWKKRPNAREKELRAAVLDCRNIRLSAYKEVIESLPVSRLCLILSGAEVPQLSYLALEALREFVASAAGPSFRGSPPSALGLLEALVLYQEVGPATTRAASTEALHQASATISGASGWSELSPQDLAAYLELSKVLLKAGIRMGGAIEGILGSLASTESRDLPEIPEEVLLEMAQRE